MEIYMFNHTFFKAFLAISLLCVSVKMDAFWPFNTVITWLRARENNTVQARLRANERECLTKQIGDDNLKKIAQHAMIDETRLNVAQQVFNKILRRPSRNSNNTPEKIAHFKQAQQEFKNKDYVINEKSECNRKVAEQYIESLLNQRNILSPTRVHGANPLSEDTVFVDKDALELDQALLLAGQRVYKLKSAFIGGKKILTGDRITKNESLLKDAYFDVDDEDHEAARELIETLEALEKMKTRKTAKVLPCLACCNGKISLDEYYQKCTRQNKNYWSVKQSYDDTIKAALNKLKED